MTYREAEANRLMAILQGERGVVHLTETGELQPEMDEDEELAPFWAACPTCGEQREDYLTLDEDDDPTPAYTGLMYSICCTCQTVFGFEYSRLD